MSLVGNAVRIAVHIPSGIHVHSLGAAFLEHFHIFFDLIAREFNAVVVIEIPAKDCANVLDGAVITQVAAQITRSRHRVSMLIHLCRVPRHAVHRHDFPLAAVGRHA